MAKLLLVEDDRQVADIVRSALLLENHVVDSTLDGLEGQKLLQNGFYDLIILDWGLPGLSGLEICNWLRGQNQMTPVLMLTGKTETEHKEQGLDAGADDYLTKPFQMKELLARVRALLRRASNSSQNNLVIAGIELDQRKHKVSKDGQPVTLLPKEFSLLEFLMRNPGQVYSAEALLAHVWPHETEASPTAVKTTMKRLRQKIDPEGKLIRNQHSVGFVLEPDA